MLDDALNRYFGYQTFLPLQREIAEATLAGRDALALLPTGGGKSLCYQLPAILEDGLTLVVSPLIALMKDQVNALEANGIRATFLNSSIDSTTAAQRLDALDRGEYRLLYVAPERLVLPGFLAGLKRWSLRRIAVERSALRQRMGPRFPAGVSANRVASSAASRRSDPRAHSDGNAARSQRHRAFSTVARSGALRRQF